MTESATDLLSLDPFSLHAHVRHRILPALMALDGLEHRRDEVLRVYDKLAADDLDFDLREGPSFASNLCADNAALELAYTFGGPDTCGLRYSFEPTCRRGMIKNRYTLFRDRVSATMRALGDDYDDGLFRGLCSVGLDKEVVMGLGGDPTMSIAAVHHYRDRAPRLKAYFGCEVIGDDDASRARMARLVDELEAPPMKEQLAAIESHFPDGGVARMVGFDFEPGRPPEAKVYFASEGLTLEGLRGLVREAGGDEEAVAGVDAFLDAFLGFPARKRSGPHSPEDLNLVTFVLTRSGPPRLKVYHRPAELEGDDKSLKRIRRWYRALDKVDELEAVERGLAAVVPLDVLGKTRGFFNYVSVDVGGEGLSKTSVYYAPQIPLMWLAHQRPEALGELLYGAE